MTKQGTIVAITFNLHLYTREREREKEGARERGRERKREREQKLPFGNGISGKTFISAKTDIGQ